MGRRLLFIAVQTLLLAALALLGSIAAANLQLNVAFVWITYLVVVVILIPTTWFASPEAKSFLPRFRLSVPETITVSVSVSSIRQSLRWLVALFLNAVLFGWLIAHASISAVQFLPQLDYSAASAYELVFLSRFSLPKALSFEVVGVFMIAFASAYFWRRSSWIVGIVFCAVASLVFSATHLSLLPFQHKLATVLGNLVSSLLAMLVFVALLPLLSSLFRLMRSSWESPARTASDAPDQQESA